MGFLRPLQAVQKPTTFDISKDELFERGSFLWLNSSGNATTDYDAAVAPLGLADDDQDTSLTGKIVGYAYSTSVTQTTGTATFTASVGKTIVSTYTATSIFTGITSATLYALISGTWTAVTTGANTGLGTVTDVTLALNSAGTFAVVLTGTGLTAGAQQYKIEFDYTYVREQAGAELVSDMFNDKSTSNLQTGVANASVKKVTVWFMDGIYESDQYDPNVAYVVGNKLYAKDNGVLTSVSTSATEVGIILKAPAANYTPATKTQLGHTQPKPEAVRFLMKLGLTA